MSFFGGSRVLVFGKTISGLIIPALPPDHADGFLRLLLSFGKERHLSGPPLKLLFSHDRPRMDS